MPVTPDSLAPRAKSVYDKVKKFIRDEIIPLEKNLGKPVENSGDIWKESPVLDELKVQNIIFTIIILCNSNRVRNNV